MKINKLYEFLSHTLIRSSNQQARKMYIHASIFVWLLEKNYGLEKNRFGKKEKNGPVVIN